MRLSAPGQLSQTSLVTIRRSWRHEYQVDLAERYAWQPLPFEEGDFYELVDFGGHADVILVERRYGEATLRRIDGETAKSIWSLPLDPKTPPIPNADDGDRWAWRLFLANFLSGNLFFGSKPGEHTSWTPNVLQPAPDLNDDGTPDLIWFRCSGSSVLSISGKDGKPLWFFHLPKTPSVMPIDEIVGPPAVADVDGDDLPDLVCCLRIIGKPIWIEAISGLNGRSLWRHEIDDFPYHYSSSGETRYAAPQLVQFGPRRLVATVLDEHLVGLDLATGEPAWPTKDLGPELCGPPPKFLDLNGDGIDELLLTQNEPDPDAPGDGTRPALRAITFEDEASEQPSNEGRPGPLAWSLPLSFDPPKYDRFGSNIQHLVQARLVHVDDLCFVADLDADDRAEIAVANNSSPMTVNILDAADGTPRWPKPRTLFVHGSAAVKRFLVVPDLDSDGVSELVVVSLGRQTRFAYHNALFVDVLSGKDGRPLSWWHKPNLGGYRPGVRVDFVRADLWQLDGAGVPQLVIQLNRIDPPGKDLKSLHVVSLTSGAETSSLVDVADVRAADVNGDGLSDLCYTRAMREGGRLYAVAGTPPEPWRRLGPAKPAQDFDDDGYVDVAADLGAFSGRDGRVLYQWPGPVGGDYLALTSPRGDLDGDGVADVLQASGTSMQLRGNGNEPLEFPLYAISGRTGDRIWSAPRLELPEQVWQEYMRRSEALRQTKARSFAHVNRLSPRCDDLDGDGQAEILCPYYVFYEGQAQLWISVLEGPTGRIQWSRAIGQVFNYGSSFSAADLPFRIATAREDLNADGAADLVLTAASHSGTPEMCQLHALSGRDGQPLWAPYPLKMQPDRNQLELHLPMPAVGDLDGDGQAEVIVTDWEETTADVRQFAKYAGDSLSGLRYELVVLNGSTGEQQTTWTWLDAQRTSKSVTAPVLVLKQAKAEVF